MSEIVRYIKMSADLSDQIRTEKLEAYPPMRREKGCMHEGLKMLIYRYLSINRLERNKMAHTHDLSYLVKSDEEDGYFVGLVEQIPAIIVEGNSVHEIDKSIQSITEKYIHSLSKHEHDNIPTESILPDTTSGRTVATKHLKIHC